MQTDADDPLGVVLVWLVVGPKAVLVILGEVGVIVHFRLAQQLCESLSNLCQRRGRRALDVRVQPVGFCCQVVELLSIAQRCPVFLVVLPAILAELLSDILQLADKLRQRVTQLCGLDAAQLSRRDLDSV